MLTDAEMEEEDGSLHLSDLSLDRNNASARVSQHSSYFGSYGRVSESDNIRDYASYLYDTKSRLECTQAAFESEMKRSRAKLRDAEETVKSDIVRIKEKEMEIRSQRAQNEKVVTRQRRDISDLESEEVRIEKSGNWAQSVLENRNDFNMRMQLRNEIVQRVSDVAEITEHIRALRSSVFDQQKLLVTISESIASLRVKGYTLNARIEAVKEDNNEDLEESSKRLSQTLAETRSVAIAQQRLAIERMRIQKRIEETQQRIEDVRAGKAEIAEKLTPLRVRDNTAIEKIMIQRDQYLAATARHREMAKSVLSTKDDCVSKEIDVKLERDGIVEAKAKVAEETLRVQQTLKEQSDTIDQLSQWLTASRITPENTPEEVTYESILRETISQIREKRDENAALNADAEQTLEVDESELDEVRSCADRRVQKVREAVEAAERETSSMRSEVTELESELMEQRSRVRDGLESVCETPKMVRELSRIKELEKSIAKSQDKCERKRAKIAKYKEVMQTMKSKIASPQQRYWVIKDIVTRIDVASHWLMGNLAKAKAQWMAAPTLTQMTQLAKDWDSRVMSAAINEAEDLEMRGSAVY